MTETVGLTAHPPPEQPGPLRITRLPPPWPYVLLGLGLLGVGFSGWHPLPTGVWHDDGVYMLIGKALAEGDGLRYVGVVGAPPAVKFPPLYPGVLAVLWSLLGSIGPVTLVATVLNLGLLAAAGALFARALHDVAGLPLGLSVTVAALGFASAEVVRTALVALSEPFFLALTMGALVLWPSVVRDEPSPARTRTVLLLAGLLAATVMVRTAGIALVAAWVVALALRGRWRLGVSAAAPAAVAAAGWSLWSSSRLEQIPVGMRDILGGYGGWFAGQTLAVPGVFLAELPGHALGVLERMASLLLPGLSGSTLWWAALPLAVLASLGLARLFRTFPPAAWWTVGYLVILLLWPYQDRRLMAPLHPFVVAAIGIGALEASRRLRARPARALVLGIAMLWAGAFGVVTAGRFASGWPGAPYRLRAEQLAAAVQALERTVPPGAIVGAPEFWPALHLHGGWTVAPSARFNPRGADPATPLWGTPEEQLALWRDAGIDHLLLEQGAVVHEAALDLLEKRCPGTVQVLAVMAPLMVVRLDRQETCGTGQTPAG